MIRLSKSCLGDSEKKAVMDVLDREFLGMGEDVQRFEKALTEFFERPAICVVNGTAALHLALQACGIGTGDEVLVQSITYVASFQAISATGARPIPCDMMPDSLTISLWDAKQRLTPRTKAIMPVHYSGGVGPLEEIYDFAQEHGLRVIEDAAHAFGSSYQGKRIGSFGDVACFSFDGIKNITSGEGGCVVAEDEVVINRIKDARLLGVEKDSDQRYTGKRSWAFDVTTQGWRYHMSNIMAAIGLVQLNRFAEIKEKRQQLALHYMRCLSDKSSVSFLQHNYSEVVPHIFPILIPGLNDRDGLQKAMAQAGIQTGYHYQPNHWLTFYKIEQQLPLSQTEAHFTKLLTLPLHEDLSIAEVEYVCSTLKSVVGSYCA